MYNFKFSNPQYSSWNWKCVTEVFSKYELDLIPRNMYNQSFLMKTSHPLAFLLWKDIYMSLCFWIMADSS